MFEKGKSGNPKGKPKGTVNKRTKATREMLQAICDGYLAKDLAKDLKMMDPKERAQIMVGLLPYYMPKMQQTTIEASVKSSGTIDIYAQLEAMSRSGVAPQIGRANNLIPAEESNDVQELIAERVEPEEVCNNTSFLEQEYDL